MNKQDQNEMEKIYQESVTSEDVFLSEGVFDRVGMRVGGGLAGAKAALGQGVKAIRGQATDPQAAASAKAQKILSIKGEDLFNDLDSVVGKDYKSKMGKFSKTADALQSLRNAMEDEGIMSRTTPPQLPTPAPVATPTPPPMPPPPLPPASTPAPAPTTSSLAKSDKVKWTKKDGSVGHGIVVGPSPTAPDNTIINVGSSQFAVPTKKLIKESLSDQESMEMLMESVMEDMPAKLLKLGYENVGDNTFKKGIEHVWFDESIGKWISAELKQDDTNLTHADLKVKNAKLVR